MARQTFPALTADQRMWLSYGGMALVFSFLLSLITHV
jgi:Na+-transporting methylmalonyl-CoA/oxaloacetate decarboxylase gamma subunit